MSSNSFTYLHNGIRYRQTIKTIHSNYYLGIYQYTDWGYELIKEKQQQIKPVWYNPTTWAGGQEYVRTNHQNFIRVNQVAYFDSNGNQSINDNFPIETQSENGYFKQVAVYRGWFPPVVEEGTGADARAIFRISVLYEDHLHHEHTLTQS